MNTRGTDTAGVDLIVKIQVLRSLSKRTFIFFVFASTSRQVSARIVLLTNISAVLGDPDNLVSSNNHHNDNLDVVHASRTIAS